MLKSLFRRTGAAEEPAETPDTSTESETPARQRVRRVGLLSPLGEHDGKFLAYVSWELEKVTLSATVPR